MAPRTWDTSLANFNSQHTSNAELRRKTDFEAKLHKLIAHLNATVHAPPKVSFLLASCSSPPSARSPPPQSPSVFFLFFSIVVVVFSILMLKQFEEALVFVQKFHTHSQLISQKRRVLTCSLNLQKRLYFPHSFSLNTAAALRHPAEL